VNGDYDFFVTQGDAYTLRAYLRDADNNPPDLTGATVMFRLRIKGLTGVIVNKPATVEDATLALVRFDGITTDSATPGEVEADFYVTSPSIAGVTFPDFRYIQGYIKPRIV
jgi:hypothetical protein